MGLDVCAVANNVTLYDLLLHLWDSQLAVLRLKEEESSGPIPDPLLRIVYLFEMSQHALFCPECRFSATLVVSHTKISSSHS